MTKSPDTVRPTADQPGTFGEQIAAILTSWVLADRRGTTAAEQWHESRERCISHVRRASRG